MKMYLFVCVFLSSFLQADNSMMLEELKQGMVTQTLLGRLTGLLGCVAMVLFAVLFSSNRKMISWRLVSFGIGLQFLFAYLF